MTTPRKVPEPTTPPPPATPPKPMTTPPRTPTPLPIGEPDMHVHDGLGLHNAATHHAPDPAPLDVERLARALEAAMSGQHVTPPALRSEFGLPPIWEPLAAAIAREYAKEPQP